MKKSLLLSNLVYFPTFFLLAIQPINAEEISTFTASTKKASRLREIEFPKTNLNDWLTQQTLTNEIIQVIGVQLNRSNDKLQIILNTPTRKKLVPLILPEDDKLVIDIPDAILALPNKNEFRKPNPAPGIREVIVNQTNENSIRITITGEKRIPTAEVIPSPQNLVLSINPNGTTAQTKPDEEIEVVATGERDNDDYFVPDASTATRTDTPLKDIPQSIQVVPSQVIEDRGVVRLSELADNVSGVQPERGYGGLSSLGFRVRGFLTNFETLRNGFPDYGYFSPRDVANIERLEILKGPAAVLYGGSPTQYAGGSAVINTVTKKPLINSQYNINTTYGSYNFIRPTLDFTGSLTEDKSVLYRLNVAYENADSFRDFVENESFFISPVVEFRISDRTKLTLEYEHQKYNYTFDSGIPIEPESLQLPRERFLGEPDFANGDVTFNSLSYNFEHKFNDNWKFRQGFNFLEANLDDAEYAYYGSLQDDRRTLDRFFTSSDEEHSNITLQNEISGKFNTGSIRHDFLFGVDVSRNVFNYLFAPDRELAIDIFDSQYGGIPTPVEDGEPFGRKIVSENVGLFTQDSVALLPNLKLLLGGRLDFNDYSNKDRVTAEIVNEQNKTRFSPRVGVVYQPGDNTSIYSNYTNGFSPQFQARSRTDEQFEPQKTEQFEVGVKQDLLGERLSATLALFQVTKQNVLTPDPVDSSFSIQTGEQRSRGVEFDIAGDILPGWKVIANYAYINGEVTKDNEIPEGDRLVGVPEHSAGLWTTYEIQKGGLKGLGFGIGLYFVDEQEVILPNTFQLASYWRSDAAIFYRRENYQVAINFKNISDVKYYEVDGYNIDPAPPFTAYGTVSFEF